VIQPQFRWARANIRLPPLQAPSEPFNGYPNTNAMLGGGRNRIRPMCGRDGESEAVPHCEDLWDDVGRSLPATACTTRPWRPLRRRAEYLSEMERTELASMRTARLLHRFQCRDRLNVTKHLVGFAPEAQRPVPSRPDDWVAPCPLRPRRVTGQPAPRILPQTATATGYAADIATGPGESLGEPGGFFGWTKATVVTWDEQGSTAWG
jgi:hypothetical protein